MGARMDATEIRSKVDEILSAHGVRFSARLLGETKRGDWTCDEWRVSIGKWEFSYYTGTGLRKNNSGKTNPFPRNTVGAEDWNHRYLKPQAPPAADVLHSLALDSEADEMSFRDWCDNFGYSEDSIDALGIYRQCCKVAEQLRRVFKPDALAAIREAVREL